MTTNLVWIIGAKGMLGTEIGMVFNQAGIQWLGSDKETDIRSKDALDGFVAEQQAKGLNIGWIVNCSAYTAVDKAEDEADLARSINAEGVGVIARCASAMNAKLVHISTDYVFGGSGQVGADGQLRPWQETDPVSPQSVYGRTKAEGETQALVGNTRTFILRTAWMYGFHGPNFVSTMLRLMEERSELGVVGDQTGSPTWARNLAEIIRELVLQDSTSYGIYHVSGEGQCSWYDFALEIQRLGLAQGILGKKIPVRSLSTQEYPTKAKRPGWSVLSKNKLNSSLGLSMPDWQDALKDYFKTL